jgi:toxin ParE1/3/4
MPARDDLKSIHEYIARDSKRYATRVIQDILGKAKTLIEFPHLGKVMADTIHIHGVIHMRRNFKPEDLGR